MNLLGRLALLFVVIPLIELVLLIQLGQVVGLGPTLGLVVLTGLVGAAMARAEGLRVLYRFQKELASGKLPGQALLDGISVLVGGAFLLTPGILTDLAGFSLLFPVTRRWIQRAVRRRLQRGLERGTIRVVTMGPGGFGWGAGFRTAETDESDAESRAPEVGQPSAGRGGSGTEVGSRGARSKEGGRVAGAPLDPSKGIVVEPKE